MFFGTGSGTPVYFPSMRPGNNPRAASIIAVDLATGKLKWWQQLIQNDQWEYDVAQPPVVYDGKVGGKAHRIVSVATKEGMWYAFDAVTGKAFHDRVKVLDRVEHPPLKAGQPVVVYPGSIGGLNYSPAAYDPKLNYIYNAAAETAGVLVQKKLTPTQKKRKFLLGDIFLGLENGNFGDYLPGWKDHGSISAIDVSTGKRVWKFDTPEPERGGVSLTAQRVSASPVAATACCARSTRRRARSSGRSRRDARSPPGRRSSPPAARSTSRSRSAARRPRPAAASPRSCRCSRSGAARPSPAKPPGLTSLQPPASPAAPTTLRQACVRAGGRASAIRALSASVRAAAGGARIAVPAGAITLGLWNANSSNLVPVKGKVLLGGKPVSGARCVGRPLRAAAHHRG